MPAPKYRQVKIIITIDECENGYSFSTGDTRTDNSIAGIAPTLGETMQAFAEDFDEKVKDFLDVCNKTTKSNETPLT